MRSILVKGVLTTTLGLGVVAGVIFAAPAIAQGDLPDGAGKDQVVAACSGCHGIGQILGEHKSADDWATTVTLMINNGAMVPDADFDKVVGYLATNFGTGAPPAAAPAAPADAAAPAPAGAVPPTDAPAPATPADATAPAASTATQPPAGGTAPAAGTPAPAPAQ